MIRQGHQLAIKVGINAAQTRVLATGEKYHTLLSQCFGRTQGGKRIHFASAMALLGLNDGDNAGIIISKVVSAVKNWRELAIRLGISKREMAMFAGVLDERHVKNTLIFDIR